MKIEIQDRAFFLEKIILKRNEKINAAQDYLDDVRANMRWPWSKYSHWDEGFVELYVREAMDWMISLEKALLSNKTGVIYLEENEMKELL